MNYDIKISDDEPTDSIWAMITKEEIDAIQENFDEVYNITFPHLKHKGLTVTGIKVGEWSLDMQRFSCDIYYFMKK